MKKLGLLSAIVFSAGLVCAAPPQINTADYYKAKPEAWLEKPVALNVAWLDLPGDTALVNGYRKLQAMTINASYWGGGIEVLVKPEAAQRIIQLCGTTHYKTQIGVVPHMIHGTFTKDGDEYAVKVDR